MSKFKSKKFWISLVAAVILLLQLFGLKIDTPYVSEVVSSICAICILVGLMADDTKEKSDENTENNCKAEEEEAENLSSDEQTDSE